MPKKKMLTQLNHDILPKSHCYILNELGQELKVTQEMIRQSCYQLLVRCKQHK